MTLHYNIYIFLSGCHNNKLYNKNNNFSMEMGEWIGIFFFFLCYICGDTHQRSYGKIKFSSLIYINKPIKKTIRENSSIFHSI